MGILKLTKGELKKIFLKPGIFVVTALLVLVLAVSAFIFNVKDRNNVLVNVSGNTVGQMYDASFGSSQSNNVLSKIYLTEKYINSSSQIIDFYVEELKKENNSKKQELYAANQTIKNSIVAYNALINGSANEEELAEDKNNRRLNVQTSIKSFNNLFNTYINGNNGFYYLLISSKDQNSYDVFMSMTQEPPFVSTITHTATITKLEELDVYNKINEYIDNLLVFMPSENSVLEAKANLEKAIENLALIEQEIETLKSEYSTNNTLEKKEEFKTLLTRYQQASINIYNLVQFSLSDSALSEFSDDQIQKLYQFENSEYITKYAIKEQKTICQFYLDNNKYAFEYATPLSLTISSNLEPNVYDFMYFALELCSFIIIIYVVFLGATMIAGEYASGTMKLLAIRPYSRNKILFSKLLATVLIGLIFLFLTFIVTFITGGILYGLESMSMIFVFNATQIASVSSLVSIIMLFLSKTVEIIFYAIFALSISTMFKSNSGSIVIAILIYFISFVLSMFTSSLGVFKYLPFVNTNLFGYFGSHALTKSGNLISNLFSRIIPNDMNFYISFIIITVFSVLLYVLTAIVFNKRDINK